MNPMIRVYTGPERRQGASLSKEQIDAIADHAAERAVEKMKEEFFKEIGKRVWSGIVWAAGVSVIAAFLWAQSKGLIK